MYPGGLIDQNCEITEELVKEQNEMEKRKDGILYKIS